MKRTGPVNNLRLLKTVSCDTGGNGEMTFHSQDPLQIQGYNIVIITTKQSSLRSYRSFTGDYPAVIGFL